MDEFEKEYLMDEDEELETPDKGIDEDEEESDDLDDGLGLSEEESNLF